MNNIQNIDKKKLLVVFIPGTFILAIFFFFIFQNTRCEKLLNANTGMQKIAYSYYSKDHMLGNGTRAVSTGFRLNYNGRNYKITTKMFAKPIPVGVPILIRFLPELPDCNEILWDSVFTHKNVKYEFFFVEGKGYDYRLTPVE